MKYLVGLLFVCCPLLSLGPWALAESQAPLKTLYVFSATHFDLFFTGPPPSSFARNHRIFDTALKLSEEQPDFRYLIENLYLFDQYLRTHPEKVAPFVSALRNGKVELAAQWADLLQNHVTGEDLVRNILVAGSLPREHSTSPQPSRL